MSETAHGATVASPNPTPRRVVKRGTKLRTTLAAAVMVHHTATPAASSARRLTRSASQPIGRPIST